MQDSLLHCRLFGPMMISRNGAPIPPLRTRKGLWLLALLLLRHDREVERAWLAGTLWPDSDESQGFYNLRRSLSDLRQALGDAQEYIQSPTQHTLLFATQNCDVDIIALENALRQSDEQTLSEAVALCDGTLLEGCSEPWVVSERMTWEQRVQEARERLAQQAFDRKDYATATHHLRRVLTADPLRESALRLLMQSLADNGEIAAVIETYRDFRLRLQRELNAQPAPETAALFQQLRARSRPSEPATVASTPPLAAPRRLPLQITSLIGREEELHQIGLLLGAGRLLTLTGAGGVGKTRLALQAAEEHGDDYRDGVTFVDLSSLSVPALVIPTIAAALEVKEVPQQRLFETLTAHLESKQVLLLLDNCEHLLAECAGVVSRLLARCPQLRLLATSRQPLGLSGEVIYRVPALSLPDVTRLTPERTDPAVLLQESSAFRLFVERATRRMPYFQLTPSNALPIAQICQDLDGLPLALELTACSLPGLTIAQIADRVRNNIRSRVRSADSLRARQETIEGTIAWSYRQLSEPERALLRRLSCFAGGFTLEAAQAICENLERTENPDTREGENIENENQKSKIKNQPSDIPDLLLELLDKSLIQYREQGEAGRYRLLETIRQFGLERLSEAGETEAIQATYLAYFRNLTGEASLRLSSSEQKDGLRQLLAEQDNIRHAMAWPSGSDTIGLRLTTAQKLSRFWVMQGRVSEGRDTLQRLLAQDSENPPTEARAWALNTLGILERWQTDYTAAYQHLQESLTLHRRLDNRSGQAALLGNLGAVVHAQGELAQALTLHEESLAIFRELEQPWDIAAELNGLGGIAQEMGDLERARNYYEECQAILREVGDRWAIAHNMLDLGGVMLSQFDYANAARLFEESLVLFQELEAPVGLAVALEDFVWLYSLTGQEEKAAILHGAAALLRESTVVPTSPQKEALYAECLLRIRTVLGAERFAACETEGRVGPLEAILAVLQEIEKK